MERPRTLNIIHIEKPEVSFNTADNTNAERDYKEWRIKASILVGHSPDAENIFSGKGPWDFCWVSGALYCRDSLGEEFDHLPLDKRLFRLILGDESQPHVLCQCGNTTFELRYGSYEISARCSNCGNEEVVYDG